MIINERLKARRLELGLTMAEVAEIVGVSEATVSRWESGNIGNMKRDRIAAYAKALKVSPKYIMGMVEDFPTCDCGYSLVSHGFQFTHEEFHQRYEKAIKKFGIYYPQNVREEIYKEMDAILATNPPLEKQIECQTEILKCCFSESLQKNNFDLRHCSFKDYVAMVLDQHVSAIPMSDECIYEMAEIYGRLPGMSEGIIYDIPPETREERRLRNIMKTLQTLNENGQLEAQDFINYLADSGKYNKPDTDD